MQCSRCRGHVAQVKGADVPANFREYYCVNCGERFWIERPSPPVTPPLASEQPAQTPSPNEAVPVRLSVSKN